MPESDDPKKPAPGQSTGETLITFTGGMLVGGVLATLAAWRRLQRHHTRPGRAIPLPTGTALNYERQLRIDSDPDLPQRVRAALRTLRQAPDCAGVHLLPGRVEVLLNSPDQCPPDGLSAGGDGWCWSIDTTNEVKPARGSDPLPDLLALGRTHAGGQLMICLRGIASCHGDPALVQQFLRAAAVQAATAGLDRDIALVGFDELQPLDKVAQLYPTIPDAPSAADASPHFTLLIARHPPDHDELHSLDALIDAGKFAALFPNATPADQTFTLTHAHDAAVLHADPISVAVRPEQLTNHHQYDGLITLLHTARQPGNIKREETPPAATPSPTGELAVRILGRVTITGAAERLHGRDVELVTMLAVHQTLSNADLCTNLGTPDWSLDLAQVNSIISRTRKRLGRAADGRHRILHYTNAGSHMYRLHDVTLDWHTFQHLLAHGGIGNLRRALNLVTDSPLIGGTGGGSTPASSKRSPLAVLHAAETLADLELDNSDPHAARQAAYHGLKVDPAAEPLWRAVMRSHHAEGDNRGIHHAYQASANNSPTSPSTANPTPTPPTFTAGWSQPIT